MRNMESRTKPPVAPVHLFRPAPLGWVLAHQKARHAGDGYASVECALWDPQGPTLVAYATQLMLFSFA